VSIKVPRLIRGDPTMILVKDDSSDNGLITDMINVAQVVRVTRKDGKTTYHLSNGASVEIDTSKEVITSPLSDALKIGNP